MVPVLETLETVDNGVFVGLEQGVVQLGTRHPRHTTIDYWRKNCRGREAPEL